MREKESDDNIRLLCKSCTEELKRKFQKRFKKGITLAPGDFIKAPFNTGTMIEHMWVKILEIKKSTIIGELDNIPLCVGKYGLGDIVEVRISDIEDVN